jgi:hypothetical protein
VFVAAEEHVRRGPEPSGGGIEHFSTRIDAFVVTFVRTARDEDATIAEREVRLSLDVFGNLRLTE